MCVVGASFPFGLWRWSSRACPKQIVKVHPFFHSLHSVEMTFAYDSRDGEEALGSTGDSLEFLGCREFRYGDNPKMIHAKSWAKYQKPVVKEFAQVSNSRIALIVDTFLPPKQYFWEKLIKRNSPVLESALSTTCAMADYLIRNNFVVDVYIPGENFSEILEIKNSQELNLLYAAMASVIENTKEDFYGLREDQLKTISKSNACFVFTLDFDQHRSQFINQLIEYNPAIKVLHFGRETSLLSNFNYRLIDSDIQIEPLEEL
jgi:uncharacterized protein (DUF58 family)